MKLALALFTYFPYGGLTRDLIAIARVCRQRGHQVRVYAAECRGGDGAEPSAVDSTDKSLELQILPIKARTNHGKNRKFAMQLKHAVAQFSPDLLVGFNKMPGLDVYYAADGCFAEKIYQRGWLRCGYQLVPRYRHHLAFEHAVFSSQSPTKTLLLASRQLDSYRNFYGISKQRVTLLPPGIARDRIAGDDVSMRRKCFREQWQLDDHDIVLLAVGSGFRTKGLKRTLKSLASLPAQLLAQTTLFVVGDDKVAPFEKIARRLGVDSKVRFVGGRDDVPQFLVGADLLIHPAYRENTGTVLLEAMVSGLPVIATEVCGYAHYLRDENMGEVLPTPFTLSALTHGIQRLLKVERNVWRARGYHFAQKADIYDLPLHACRHIESIAENCRFQSTEMQQSIEAQ